MIFNKYSSETEAFACMSIMLEIHADQEGACKSKDEYITRIAGTDRSIRRFLEQNTADFKLKDLRSHANDTEPEVLRQRILGLFVSDRDAYPATAGCICDLALKILDVKDGEVVADLCCGTGTFIEKAFADGKGSKFHGIEIIAKALAIAKIKSHFSGSSIEYHTCDLLQTEDNIAYDKFFMDPPYGQKEGYINFLNFAIEHLNEKGMGVVLAYSPQVDQVKRRSEKEFWSKVLSLKFLKAVIKLPANTQSYTSIPLTLLVFEKRVNNNVRFIDATNVETQRDRTNHIKNLKITNNGIKDILSRLEKDGNHSKFASIEKIRENNYCLNPDAYLKAPIKFLNQATIKDICKKITRGAMINNVNVRTETTKTSNCLLKISDIKEGYISEDLQSIDTIEPRFEKYRVAEGDVVVSVMCLPLRAAVVENVKNKKILANSNLFILSLDEKKMDPHYFVALFNSKLGREIMNRKLGTTAVSHLGIRTLESLNVPLLPMEEQEKIAGEYVRSITTIKEARKKIKQTEGEMFSLFDGMLLKSE